MDKGQSTIRTNWSRLLPRSLAGRLTAWLNEVTALRAPLLPVLLHGDLPCPSCGYLRAGLPLERACPECGAAGFEGLVMASGTSLPPATPVVKPLTYLALGLFGCLAALIADVGEGVFIERFLGGNSNETTGEISVGCAGRIIRGGRLEEPVSEVNLAGHFGQLWEALVAVGNDPDPNSSASSPTCVFEGVQLSGV